jgi:hypothetical protein
MALDDSDSRDNAEAAGRLAALYRAVSTEQPPKHLDRVIMNDARAKLQLRRPTWRLRWRLPLVTAAVAVVSASLVSLVVERRGDKYVVTEMREMAPTDTPSLDSKPTLPPPSEPNTAVSERAVKPERPAPKANRSVIPREQRVERGLTDARSAADGTASDQPLSSNSTPSQEASRSAAAPPASAGALEPRPMGPESKVAQTFPQPSAGALAKRAPSARKESDATLPFAGTVSGLIADLDRQPSARWFDKIIELRREGHREEADALLAEFKRRYPDEPLPPSLRSRE